MLPWVCKVIDHRKHRNVAKTLQVGAWGGVSRRLPSLPPILWPIHRHPPKEFICLQRFLIAIELLMVRVICLQSRLTISELRSIIQRLRLKFKNNYERMKNCIILQQFSMLAAVLARHS